MIASIRAVIFDLGDTLIYDKDPWPPIFRRADLALLQALGAAGCRVEPRALFRGQRGLLGLYYNRRGDDPEEETTAVLLKQLLSEQGCTNMSDDIVAEALRAMYTVTQSNWYPEADAVPTLHTLRERGFRLGLISNAADDANTQALIDKGGFRPYLEFIRSSATLGKRKPHPAIFQAALDYFQVPANQALMIGDLLETDILGANRVGMKSVWITRRIDSIEPVERLAPAAAGGEGARPDAVVSALSEIPPLLAG